MKFSELIALAYSQVTQQTTMSGVANSDRTQADKLMQACYCHMDG